MLNVLLACAVIHTLPAAAATLPFDTTGELKLGVYITAGHVKQLNADDEMRQKAVARLREIGVSRVILEVYRSGVIIAPGDLRTVRDCFLGEGFEVWGGIATTPGGDVGVHQEAPLGWFNWQNPKTRDDLRKIVVESAPVFDVFIVDDFLCTGDLSAESKAAKGGQSWAEYRIDLMTRVAREVFVDPAREAHPGITMIIKYPQWYDKFHEFGYNIVGEPPLFDAVWVGTETRGARTQRYGFVQPYEGFVNYRWIGSGVGGKLAGAWFDHGDCDPLDYLEQAYQSALAGANNFILFQFGDLMSGHGGNELLREHHARLNELAAYVDSHPVVGVTAYKPAQSDAGHDVYLFDFVGMLGVPLVPDMAWPGHAPAYFLATQAAADAGIEAKVADAIQRDATVVMTPGFLYTAKSKALADMAGVELVEKLDLLTSQELVMPSGGTAAYEQGFEVAANLVPVDCEVLLKAIVGGKEIPYLTRLGKVYVLNTWTYSQADFDAADEVLLAPRPLGIIDLPREWANTLRAAFLNDLGMRLDAPGRVTFQPFADESGVFVYNYNLEPVTVRLSGKAVSGWDLASGDALGAELEPEDEGYRLALPERTGAWLTGSKDRPEER